MDKKSFIKSCRRNGYKYIEIAKILGLSRQRIEQILHKEKHNARHAVLKAGIKRKDCEYPGCTEKSWNTEAHHWDYSKPLDVAWLCVKHHKEYHKKIEKKPEYKNKLCGCGKEAQKYSIRCKDCAKKRALKMSRLNYKNNPKRRALQKLLNYKWIKNNPEKWKIISRRAVKKYQETHPQHYKGYNKEYYEKNKEKILLNWRNYYKRNKEKINKRRNEYYKSKKIANLST